MFQASRPRAIVISVILSCVAVFAAIAVVGCAYDTDAIEANAALAFEEDCQFSLDVAAGLGEEMPFAIERWGRAAERNRAAVGKKADPAFGRQGASQADIEEYQAAIAALELQDLQIVHLEFAGRACAFVVTPEELRTIHKLTSELRDFREEIHADCEKLVSEFEETHPSEALDCNPYVD